MDEDITFTHFTQYYYIYICKIHKVPERSVFSYIISDVNWRKSVV